MIGDSGKGFSLESWSDETLVFPLALPANKVRAHELGLWVDDDDDDDEWGIFNASDFAWKKDLKNKW